MDTNTLELVPVQPGEPAMKQLAPFLNLEQQARKMIEDAESIALLPPTPANAKVARAMRLEIKPLRVSVEKRHAELKRPIIDAGNALDEGKNALLDLLKPMEAKLLAIEQHAEREAARIEGEKRELRMAELSQIIQGVVAVDLGKLSDEEYSRMLQDAKDAKAARDEREAKAKAEAEEAAKAERERIEAQAIENERLKKEAEIREIAARKEREEAAAQLAKERAEAARWAREAEAKARAEREAANEAARVQAELERKEREKIAAKARAEREAREKVEAELAAVKAAEAKAAADKLAAERKAAAAPDKAKLKKLAEEIRAITQISIAEKALQGHIASQGEKFAVWIEKQADSI